MQQVVKKQHVILAFIVRGLEFKNKVLFQMFSLHLEHCTILVHLFEIGYTCTGCGSAEIHMTAEKRVVLKEFRNWL